MDPLSLVPACALILGSSVNGDITYYKNNEAQWISDVGKFTTIGFDDLGERAVVITEQYADIGVHFPEGDEVASPSDGTEDGWRVRDNPGQTKYIIFEFDKPQYWLGVDHAGGMAFELYVNENLIDEPHLFSVAGTFKFAGVVSDIGFNKVRLYDPVDGSVNADNIHFGAPPSCLLADLNCDGTVDGADLGLLLSAWGVEGDPADFNADGTVDGGDLGILLGEWVG
jgi:hypothetical protein